MSVLGTTDPAPPSPALSVDSWAAWSCSSVESLGEWCLVEEAEEAASGPPAPAPQLATLQDFLGDDRLPDLPAQRP